MTTTMRVLGLVALLAASGCSRRPAPATPPAPAPRAAAPAAPAMRPARPAPAPVQRTVRPAAPVVRSASTSTPAAHGITGAAFSRQNVPFDEMVSRARTQGRPAILYFCATWCGWCKKMNRETLPDARVQARLREFPTALYDPNTDAGRAVADRYDIWSYPTMVVVDGSGNELDRIPGASNPEDFLARLARY